MDYALNLSDYRAIAQSLLECVHRSVCVQPNESKVWHPQGDASLLDWPATPLNQHVRPLCVVDEEPLGVCLVLYIGDGDVAQDEGKQASWRLTQSELEAPGIPFVMGFYQTLERQPVERTLRCDYKSRRVSNLNGGLRPLGEDLCVQVEWWLHHVTAPHLGGVI